MSGKIESRPQKVFLSAMKKKFTEITPPDNTVRSVYESTAPLPAMENREVKTMLADIISRLDRIEEKIDENVYPPESAIKPEFIRQVKKAEADVRKGKGKTYESMDAFIRAISE